jgi:hypothetical protein
VKTSSKLLLRLYFYPMFRSRRNGPSGGQSNRVFSREMPKKGIVRVGK